MGNSKHKSLTCNYCHKKGHIRSECWLWNKKQLYANVTELVRGDEKQCDVLFVTNRLVGNKDRWIIDSGYSHYISSNRKMFSSYTSVQGGEVFMEIQLHARWLAKEQFNFLSHDGCITTFQGVRHVSDSMYNLISLRALHREGLCFSSKGDLMKVFKEAHVMFQAERVGNVYMLWNSEVTVGGLQLSSASKVVVVEQS